MYSPRILSVTIFSAIAVFSAHAQVSVDFETDASSQFTVRNAAGDFLANFNYDYSTFTPASPDTTPASIPAAPSGPGTKGLRLEVNNNDAVGAVDAVTIYPNAAAGSSNYTLKFDMWMNYNGGAGGGNGSTEFLVVGGHADGAQAAHSGATAFNGFFFTATGDGDAGQDYRYYEGAGAGPVRADAVPNWNGANELDHGAAGWQALFPSPTYETAGVPGKAWTVVEVVVNGGNVTAFMTPTGGSRTQIGSWAYGTAASGAPMSGYPLVGYWDLFTSIASPAANNFMIIDNLSVTQGPTSVNDWALFN